MKGDKRLRLESDLVDAERRVFELKAQLASTLSKAFDDLPKAGDAFKGSGVIIQITTLGGKQVLDPVLIRDGLSKATIVALQKDVALSFEFATMVNPAMSSLLHLRD